MLGDSPGKLYIFYKDPKWFLFKGKFQKHYDLHQCFSDINVPTSHSRPGVAWEPSSNKLPGEADTRAYEHTLSSTVLGPPTKKQQHPQQLR